MIARTSEYFTRASSRALNECSSIPLVRYLKWVLEAFRHEESSVASILPAWRSRRQLFYSLKNTLLDQRSVEIENGIIPLLARDDQEGLREVFLLLRRLPNGLSHLNKVLHTHILAMAKEALDAVRIGNTTTTTSSSSAPSASTAKPRGSASGSTTSSSSAFTLPLPNTAYIEAFVTAALTVHSKFDSLVDEVFESDPSLVHLTSRCTRLYLNSAANGTAAELLARYCSLQLLAQPPNLSAPPTPTASLLSKASAAFGFGGGHEEHHHLDAQGEERASKLRRSIRLLSYLDDKQMFFTPFGSNLATRLIQRSSYHMRLERLALKLVCEIHAPHELGSKLHRMLADANASRELTSAFREHAGLSGFGSLLRDNQRVDFEVLVLTAGAWPSSLPLGPSDWSDLAMPEELIALKDAFADFYTTSHSSRTLKWQHAASTIEVSTRYLTSHVQRTLRVSASQLAILLPFNNGPISLSLLHLAQASKLHRNAFTEALLSLRRARLLTCTGAPSGKSPRSPTSDSTTTANADDSPDASAVAASVASALGLSASTATVRLEPGWVPTGSVAQDGEIVPVHLITAGQSFAGGTSDATTPTSQTPPAAIVRGGSTLGLSADDARMLVQAAIVRALKKAGTMSHAELLTSLSASLEPRLTPEAGVVRKCIEFLIDKEYIERRGKEEVYVYVP